MSDSNELADVISTLSEFDISVLSRAMQAGKRLKLRKHTEHLRVQVTHLAFIANPVIVG
jgi:hypothetical protein